METIFEILGAIFYLKEDGTSEEVLTSGSSVKFLLYHQSRDILIVMTDAAILGQFEVDPNGELSEVNKVSYEKLPEIIEKNGEKGSFLGKNQWKRRCEPFLGGHRDAGHHK